MRKFVDNLNISRKQKMIIQVLMCPFSFDVGRVQIIFSRNQLTCRAITDFTVM
jgi:hypothetical protein